MISQQDWELLQSLLDEAAYFNMFAVDNPEVPDVPIPAPGNPNAMIGLYVHDVPHRFDIAMALPGAKCGLRAANIVGEQAANLSLRWMVIPDDFVPAPGKEPPPTPLDYTRSQRFTMMDGDFSFGESGDNHFHGFGSGRTFPAVEGGRPVLRLGAIANIMEGFGVFKGKLGIYVIQGYITPPKGLFLNYLCRVTDQEQDLVTDSELPAIEPTPNPDPTATFLYCYSHVNRNHTEAPLVMGSGGQPVGLTGTEEVHLVHLDFAVERRRGPRSQMTMGPVIGSHVSTTLFYPSGPDPGTPLNPIPWYGQNNVFTFWDKDHSEIGTVTFDFVEGRGFGAQLQGAPETGFQRFAGFGPFSGGTGQFAGMEGMVSCLGAGTAVPINPHLLSTLYVFRIVDPDGKFRSAMTNAWW
jgi:hypothetical protein